MTDQKIKWYEYDCIINNSYKITVRVMNRQEAKDLAHQYAREELELEPFRIDVYLAKKPIHKILKASKYVNDSKPVWRIR